MACPDCGGTARTELAYSEYLCVSEVLETHVEPDPWGRPCEIQQIVTCNRRYQELPPIEPPLSAVAPIPQCECGLYSVGVCRCHDKPVCVRHGRLINGDFLCQETVERREREAEAESARVRSETEAARREQERNTTSRSKKVFERFLAEMEARHWPGAIGFYDDPSRDHKLTAWEKREFGRAWKRDEWLRVFYMSDNRRTRQVKKAGGGWTSSTRLWHASWQRADLRTWDG